MHTLICFWFLCRKIEKCNFWVDLRQKGIPGRDSANCQEERDQNAPFCLKQHGGTNLHLFRVSTAREGPDCKNSKKAGGKLRFARDEQCRLPRRTDELLCSRQKRGVQLSRQIEPDEGQISPSSKHESCSPGSQD